MFTRYLLYPAEALALLAVFAVLLRVRLPRWLAWAVAAFGAAVFLLFAGIDYRHDSDAGKDFRIFWAAGRAILSGEDPYQEPAFLNPPTALPLYTALGLMPYDPSRAVWTAFNVLGYLALVPLAQRTISALPDERPARSPPWILAVLAAAVVLSYTCRFGLLMGQVSVFVVLVLMAALYAQARGRPVLAGLPLALATVKPGTLIPFVLLSLRDRRGWLTSAVALPAFCLLFALLTNPPLSLVERCRECLANIQKRSQAGGYNDYSFDNRMSHAGIVSLDHAFYCVGLRDRGLIAGLQLAVLAAIGLWLAWRFTTDRRLPPMAAAAMVACYSCVFLYHRFHDLIILVIPLVYATGRSLEERGAARWLYSACVVAVLGALYLRVGWLGTLSENLDDGLGGRLLGIFVLPYVTWLVLGVLFGIAAAERLRHTDGLLPAAGPSGEGEGP